MPVSQGLQKHFNKKRKKKHVASKLKKLEEQIDPAFFASFERFRSQVLGIVDTTPESAEAVSKEIGSLETKLQRVNNKKSVKRFHAITGEI